MRRGTKKSRSLDCARFADFARDDSFKRNLKVSTEPDHFELVGIAARLLPEPHDTDGT